MQFDQVLELAVGDTIVFENRVLTLLDIEDGVALFRLHSANDDEPDPRVDPWELSIDEPELQFAP